MIISLTPEQQHLKSNIEKANRLESIVTQVLQYKLEGLTHSEIASKTGFSVSYINKLSAGIRYAK